MSAPDWRTAPTCECSGFDQVISTGMLFVCRECGTAYSARELLEAHRERLQRERLQRELGAEVAP